MYRVSWPAARVLGRMGVKLSVVLDITHDSEAGVFIAVSKDVPGLVVEGDSVEQVMREARNLIPELMEGLPMDMPTTYAHLTECAA